jgi:hypothetical protein
MSKLPAILTVTRTLFALVLVVALAPVPAAATDYYVSVSGADTNSGTIASPWRTLARVTAATLGPGDRVLLRGGDAFASSLLLDERDAGSAAAPVIITSYGVGTATIAPASGTGIYVHNAGGVDISNLSIIGRSGDASGISVYADLPGGVLLERVHIDNVDVSGFDENGIDIGSWNGSTGFRDIRVTNTRVHGNGRTGLLVYAEQPNVHRSVYIGQVTAYSNPGIVGSTTNTGSGIVLGGVNGGTIEDSSAYDNGANCTASEGPVGIWAYDSTAVTIQRNESYRNRSGGAADGGGFDLDQNVSNSVVQNNWSHDNAGAGFLLAQGLANDLHTGNIVRDNRSENDGRQNGNGGIEIWGRVRNADIYGNTVIRSSAISPGSDLRIWNQGITDRLTAGVHVHNNVFQMDGGLPFVIVTTTALAGVVDLRFYANTYTGTGTWAWGTAVFTTDSAWLASGHEVAGTPPAAPSGVRIIKP